MTKDAVIALLDRYATSDEKHWRTGKVRGCRGWLQAT